MVMFVPTELVIDIFLRLPAKSILRFRCVCRNWLNVIDSKIFTNTHLIKNKTNCCLIVQGWGQPCLYSVDLKSLEEAVKLDVRSWWPDDRWNEYCGVRLWGSCNGLLCLSSSMTDVALWNPSTWFGYDSAVDDYKVVSIVRHYTNSMILINTDVNVFSLRSKSWRRVSIDFPKESPKAYTCAGLLVRNSLYWLLTTTHNEFNGDSIVAFDLRTEELEVFSFASSMKGCVYGELSLQVIEERIAASLFRANVGFELWVMEEYGVKESWTKLISIGEESLTAYGYIWPIQYCRNKRMLVGSRSGGCPTKVGWYDSQTKAIEETRVRGLPNHVYRNTLFSESLVPLYGGGC